MVTRHAAIEKHLREVLCPRCVRFTDRRTCSLPKQRPCALFANLDTVIELVTDNHSDCIEPYLTDLRMHVCANCAFEDEHGACACRDNLDCALDSYFPLITEIIEDQLGGDDPELKPPVKT